MRSLVQPSTLKKILVTGEVSINKLERIQSVATKENEEFWATQVQLLPNRALETLVRDERAIQNPDAFQKPLFKASELHVQPDFPKLSNELKKLLLKLQE